MRIIGAVRIRHLLLANKLSASTAIQDFADVNMKLTHL